MCLLCGLWLTSLGSEVAGASADYHVFAGRLNFDLPVALVAFFVERVVAKHVLRAKLSSDLPKCVRQRRDRVRAQKSTAGFLCQRFQITVSSQVGEIEHPFERFIFWTTRRRRAARRLRIRHTWNRFIAIVWVRRTFSRVTGWSGIAPRIRIPVALLISTSPHDLIRQRQPEWTSPLRAGRWYAIATWKRRRGRAAWRRFPDHVYRRQRWRALV